MNRVFVIADTHFGHKKVVDFRPWKTVEEHDLELITKWNSVVKKHDTVWHLGDVCLGGREKLEIIRNLNGIKKLVLGNHDTYPLELYLQVFNKVYGAIKYKNGILTHIPVHPNQLDTRFAFNIHGHMHSKKLEDPRYICVSAEQLNYYPKPINELLDKLK